MRIFASVAFIFAFAVSLSSLAGQTNRSVKTWAIVSSPTIQNLNTIHGNGNEIWIAGNDYENKGTVLHRVNSHWINVRVDEIGGQCTERAGLWVNSANDVWIGCSKNPGDTSVHWNGKTWEDVDTEDNRTLSAFWSSGPNDVWGAAGAVNKPGDRSSYFGHYSGNKEWTNLTGNISATALWGDENGILWATHNTQIISISMNNILKNGPNPNSVAATYSGDKFLKGIWGTNSKNIWAVGEAGTLLHFDGVNWSLTSPMVSSFLNSVSGHRANNLWAVGDSGIILHYDGVQWSKVPSPTQENIHSVWVSSTGDAWAVGDNGVILHLQ